MKTILTFLFWGLFCTTCYCQQTSKTKTEAASTNNSTKQLIKVTNLQKIKGTLYIGWYTQPDNFPINDKAVHRKELNIDGLSEIVVEFKDIPTGNYAIAVFLDEDGDYILDKNMFGIPEEKYGFSNNVLPLLRPATFNESRFSVTENRSMLVINLK